MALQQLVPGYEGDELFDPALLKELAAAIPAEDVQLYYQTAILGRRDLPFAPDPRTGFEMTLVRMLAFRPAGGAAVASAPGGGGARVGSRARRARALPSTTCRSHRAAGVRGSHRPGAVVARHRRSRRHAARRASSRPTARSSNTAAIRCRFAVDPKVARTPPQVEKLTQALAKYLGGHVKLEFVDGAPPVETPAQHGERRSAEALDAARRVLEEDPTVREMKSRFGATLHPESVRPTE